MDPFFHHHNFARLATSGLKEGYVLLNVHTSIDTCGYRCVLSSVVNRWVRRHLERWCSFMCVSCRHLWTFQSRLRRRQGLQIVFHRWSAKSASPERLTTTQMRHHHASTVRAANSPASTRPRSATTAKWASMQRKTRQHASGLQ